MFGRLSFVAAVALAAALVAAESQARNPAYYGTQRHTSARFYSGEYQASRPNVVPTFSLPVYGGGYRTYYRGGHDYYGGGYYGGFYNRAYSQPVVIYPPAVYYGY